MLEFRGIAVAILALTFITFTVLFGRIPALRKTPIGFLYRVIWIHSPKTLQWLDGILTGGRVSRYGTRTGHYLMHENHPLVLVFFVVLMLASEAIFIPSAWSRLDLGHRSAIPIVVLLPYLLLYLSVTTSSAITPENHKENMRRYPYDRIIYHPAMVCRTCHLLKPARSKHCSLCNACVSRHDHHCIWLRTCVGQNNYAYFLGLLLSTSVLLGYGAYLGYMLLDRTLQYTISPSSVPTSHWSQGLSWGMYSEFWFLALADDIRIGAVFLLASLTTPLASAMLCYHIYLIWAGMTTNESAKWADWRDDIADGLAYTANLKEVHQPFKIDGDVVEPNVPWPLKSEKTLVYTTNGQPPKVGFSFTTTPNSIIQPDNPRAAPDSRWVQVQNLKEIVNIYDLGFWTNLRHSLAGR